MAKIDPRLPNLPSISELLGHPTVRAVVERLNQSTVAQRATGFLEELRAGLLERHEKGIIPTAEELAERFARHLLGVKPHHQQIINATGMVGGLPGLMPPLAESALHQVLYRASEYQLADESLQERAIALLCQLTGAETACIADSFAEAVMHCSRLDAKVCIAPIAGMVDPQDWNLNSVPSINERLKESELVVVEGSGLLGGPPCGIVLGNQQSLNQLSVFAGDGQRQIDAMRLTALVATLELYQGEINVIHRIPVLQLLSTPLENLKQRCQRMAPLLEQSHWVAEAIPEERNSCWWQTSGQEYCGASWGIALRLVDSSAESLVDKLKARTPGLWTRAEDDFLLLDLRSVFPRWDQEIVTAFSA